MKRSPKKLIVDEDLPDSLLSGPHSWPRASTAMSPHRSTQLLPRLTIIKGKEISKEEKTEEGNEISQQLATETRSSIKNIGDLRYGDTNFLRKHGESFRKTSIFNSSSRSLTPMIPNNGKNRHIFREQQKSLLRRAVIRGDFMNGAHDHILTGEYQTTFSNWNLRKFQLLFYISSNVNDSEIERKFLHEIILPRLRSMAWSYDIEVIAIDMNEGYTDGIIALESQTWQWASKEIENCRNNSCGLFFTSLQNDLYGIRSLPQTLEKRQFEDRVESCSNEELCSLAREWYQLDQNNDPICYRLKNYEKKKAGSDEHKAPYALNSSEYYWENVVPKLRLLFLDLRFNKYLCRDVAIGKCFTEWEIKLALRNDTEEDLTRCIWIQRRLVDDYTDQNYSSNPKDELLMRLLHELHEWMNRKLNKYVIAIPELHPIVETTYLSLVTKDRNTILYHEKWMSDICGIFETELNAIIQMKIQWELDAYHHLGGTPSSSIYAPISPGLLFTEYLYHCSLAHNLCITSYLRERDISEGKRLFQQPNRRVHDPRDVIAKKLLVHSHSAGTSASVRKEVATGRYNCISFAIVGEEGTGKSSLIAQLANIFYEDETQLGKIGESGDPLGHNVSRPVVVRFCGRSVDCSHGKNLSMSLRHQIEYLLGPYPQSKGGVDNELLRELLAYHAVVILLDGVDLILDELNFLVDLNPHSETRIIISCNPNSTIYELIQRENIPVISLGPVLTTPITMINSPSTVTAPATSSASPSQSPQRHQMKHSKPPVRHGNSISPLKPPNSSPGVPIISRISSQPAVTSFSEKATKRESDIYVEAKEVLYYLLKHKKRFSENSWNEILSYLPSNPTALYLRVVSCILELSTSLPFRMTPVEPDLDGILHQYFVLIEREFTTQLCERCFSYISLSACGVKESEMNDLLSLENNLLLALFPNWEDTVSTRRVPNRIWSRLKATCKSFLYENINGCTEWKNTVVKELVLRRYLSDDEKKIQFEKRMADYYGNKIDISTRNKKNIPAMSLLLSGKDVWNKKSRINYRRCEESVGHFINSEQIQEAVDEICSIEYICCCVHPKNILMLNMLLKHFQQISKLSENEKWSHLPPQLKKRVEDYWKWIEHSRDKFIEHGSDLIPITVTCESPNSIAREDFLNLSQQKYYKKVLSFHDEIVWIRGFSYSGQASLESNSVISAKPINIKEDSDRESETTGSQSQQETPQTKSSDMEKRKFKESSSINCACWSCDDLHIASGSDDCKIRIWLVRSYECTQTLSGHTKPVSALSYHPNPEYSHQLLSGSRDCSIFLWDTSTASLLRTIHSTGSLLTHHHTLSITVLLWHPNGNEFVSGSKDSKIIIWSTTTYQPFNCLKNLNDYYITHLSYNHNGSDLAIASFTTTIRLWSSRDNKYRSFCGHKQQVCAIDWNKRYEEKIASCSDDATVQIWNPLQPLCIYTVFRNHHKAVKHLSWCLDGIYVASGDCSGRILIWNSQGKNEIIADLVGHMHQITTLKWSRDGYNLLSSSEDGNMIVWDSVHEND